MMKKLILACNLRKQFYLFSLQFVFFFSSFFSAYAQLRVPFTQRTSHYSPSRNVYNIKGDFAMIGNTNLTLQNYADNLTNNNSMIYVDVDNDINTFNSSSANLTFSTENGAIPSCSKIIYAGLYWTGRASDINPSNNVFDVTKNNITKTFDKRVISFKGPQSTGYTQFTASETDIYYPNTTDGYMYSAYAEVTDYVRSNGLGEYFAADIALVEGNGGGTGFYGGWGLVVVYENSKMKYRDVTVFDGHAYVAGSVVANFEVPVSGFNAVQAGQVDIKLGLMAGEGDRVIAGDFFQVRNHTDNSWISLNHAGNASNNFFNSSIATGGNIRNPNLLNNTGLDISVFNIPNSGNSVITNNQTSTTFRYGTTQDTYVIFAIVFAVDAYIPSVENINTLTAINNLPVTTPPYSVLPGEEMTFTVSLKNLGIEAINNHQVIIPIPFNASYVPGSAVGNVFFTPLPTPNAVSFNPNLGATGSLVWDFGTLPIPTDPNTLLGSLTFKLRACSDCSILSNPNCAAPIALIGSSKGTGAFSGINFTNQFIQGYSQNGICVGETIAQPYNVTINASNYVNANCQNTPLIRNFNFCNASTTVTISQVAPNFPAGSFFYNQFPVTQSAIQYTTSNPFPLVVGSTTTYYAVPPNGGGCFFPFTISKCGVIDAINDLYSNINCTTTGVIGNVISNDLLNNSIVPSNIVTFTLLTSSNPNISISSAGIINITSGIAAGTYTFTYRICENANPTNYDNATITIIVVDTIAPVIVALPATSTISCPATPSFATASATDTCGPAILSFVDVRANGSCAGSYSITRTWTATDASGNTSTASQTINVTDTTAPVIAALPATSTISCQATPSFATATATDTCGSAFTLTFNDVRTNGLCAGSYSVTRKWTATDACGNESTATQTIVVQDTTAPTVVTPFPTLLNTTCSSIPAVPQLVFTDACSSTPLTIVTNETTSTVASDGTYTIVRTWTVTDACGNGDTFTQTVNVTITDYFKTHITEAECSVDITLQVNVMSIINDQFGTQPTGGTWTDVSSAGALDINNGEFTPLNLANGSYIVRYETNDSDCPSVFEITIPTRNDFPTCTVAGCQSLVVYNAITPNGDALNDVFVIENITNLACYPENTVEIYNRWGVKVFDTTNYDNRTRVFTGISEDRETVNQSAELPTGTYFYILKYKTSNGNYVTKNGYLYLAR